MANKTLIYILGGAAIYYFGYKYYKKNKTVNIPSVVPNSPTETPTETPTGTPTNPILSTEPKVEDVQKCSNGQILMEEKRQCKQAPCPIIKSCQYRFTPLPLENEEARNKRLNFPIDGKCVKGRKLVETTVNCISAPCPTLKSCQVIKKSLKLPNSTDKDFYRKSPARTDKDF